MIDHNIPIPRKPTDELLTMKVGDSILIAPGSYGKFLAIAKGRKWTLTSKTEGEKRRIWRVS